MPVVKVDFDGRTCLLVLPRRSSSGAWAWDELRVVPSPLAGLGLACRSTRALDWGKLPYPVLLPYVGRTTVVEHEQEATVLSSVLRGCFRTLPFRRLLRTHPTGPYPFWRNMHRQLVLFADGAFGLELLAAYAAWLPHARNHTYPARGIGFFFRELLRRWSTVGSCARLRPFVAARTVKHFQGSTMLALPTP